jgi:ABC-type cobalamin/Fe3+-siderophores transport systems, ATPase components
MTTPMLSIEGVSHSYGRRRALDNVTFAVAPATFSVLLGLNGAGKSTLFALITRLYGTQHGRIRILDFDVHRSPARHCAFLESCSSREPSISISRSCKT